MREHLIKLWHRLKDAFKPADRVKTPTLLQMEAVECGAAALGIVLRHYGRYVPLEELRVRCGVGRDGANAKNVLQAARHYGLVAKGFKKSLEALRELPKPVILFWNFNHFLVLEGYGKDRVYLNDPMSGPRTVSEEALDEGYTGVVLTMEPGPDFIKEGSAPSLIGPLRQRLRGSELAVSFAVIAGLALVIPGLVVPTFSAVFVDKILVGGLHHWLKPLLVGMGVTALLRAGLTWLREYYLLRLETKLSVSTSGQFFWHVLQLPIQFYTQRYAGEISSRVALNDQVAKLLSGRLATTAIDVVMVVFYALLMFFYDWSLTLIGIAAVCVNVAVMKAVSRKREDGNRRLLQDQGKFAGTAMAGLGNIETLKATGSENDFFARLGGYQAKLINAQQQMGVQTLFFMAVPPLMAQLSNVLVLSLGGYRVMEGGMTMGMLVAFQSLMSSFMGPVNSLTNLGAEMQAMHGNMNRLDDVLNYHVDPQVAQFEPTQNSVKLSGYLELKDITFGYSPLSNPLVENFNLSLKPGGRVALVGSSGCGKSTIAKIVCGLFDPWSGDVLFDGKTRKDLPRTSLTESVTFVDQDIVLYEGSIRDNLTLWDTTVPDTQVIQACKDALIHGDITSRVGGYDGPMAEGGANFSGGQRQRLEIARALVSNPRILVLDEATSALDPVTEKLIDENLRKRGCTCLIVAHRLSTIRDCDEIIVLDRGQVVQRGSHDALVEDEDGFYAKMIRA